MQSFPRLSHTDPHPRQPTQQSTPPFPPSQPHNGRAAGGTTTRRRATKQRNYFLFFKFGNHRCTDTTNIVMHVSCIRYQKSFSSGEQDILHDQSIVLPTYIYTIYMTMSMSSSMRLNTTNSIVHVSGLLYQTSFSSGQQDILDNQSVALPTDTETTNLMYDNVF